MLFATSNVHQGWTEPGDRRLDRVFRRRMLGAHAFAIVGYDRRGLWIQNSWGDEWGYEGFACISYDDWLQNATDVWVARLGAPIELKKSSSTAVAHSASAGQSAALFLSRSASAHHQPRQQGRVQGRRQLRHVAEEIARAVQERTAQGHRASRVTSTFLLHAHGGLVSENSAVQRLADYRRPCCQPGIYPFTFIWHSDLLDHGEERA